MPNPRDGRRSGSSGTGRDSDVGGGNSVADGRDTLYRSENNFGSSSEIPGVDVAPAAGASKERRSSTGVVNALGTSDRAANDEGRKGAGAAGPARETDQLATAATASTSGPSNAVIFPLLVLLLAVGAIVGVAASRRRRGTSTR